MALIFGFVQGTSDWQDQHHVKLAIDMRYQRLSPFERNFYGADPWMQLGLLMLMVNTGVGLITPSSVDVLISRFRQLDAECLILLARRIAAECIRDGDHEDVRTMAKELIDTPFDRMVFSRKYHDSILRFWLLDRFGGFGTNVGVVSATEWRSKILACVHGMHRVDKKTSNRWSAERKDLFAKFMLDLPVTA